jgi:hypothetical protein
LGKQNRQSGELLRKDVLLRLATDNHAEEAYCHIVVLLYEPSLCIDIDIADKVDNPE